MTLINDRNRLSLDDPGVVPTRHWHLLQDGRVQCDICPRACKLKDGQRGLCFVRACVERQVVLTTYGRSSGFVIDPIEKKPLNHFYPGSAVLSFGTAGCNLACKFCQNWDMSKSREMDTLMDQASPKSLAKACIHAGCKSIAYTYNDPVIFHEYAIDVAQACREHGIQSVAVSAGYQCPAPRKEFYAVMDAANIDLKAFTEDFYWKMTGSHLKDVLDTLLFLKHETSVWFELTNLIIPGKNDSTKELEGLSQWVVDNLGQDIPIHFTAFHPDYKMKSTPHTPANTLIRAREIAMATGIHFVYTGNVHDKEGGSTYCKTCNQLLIGRDWYELDEWHLVNQGRCDACGTVCPGHFAEQPGNWGAKRARIEINNLSADASS